MPEHEFRRLETDFKKPADHLLDGFMLQFDEFDTDTLLGIADYRDAIQPDGWMQQMIREYVDVWR